MSFGIYLAKVQENVLGNSGITSGNVRFAFRSLFPPRAYKRYGIEGRRKCIHFMDSKLAKYIRSSEGITNNALHVLQ